MANIIIIPEKESPWMKWLLIELEKREYNVKILPETTSSFEEWKQESKENLKLLDEESIIIGHGLGAIFALNILNNKLRAVQGTFLVAGYSETNKEEQEYLFKELDFKDIKKKSKHFYVYASDNDETTSYEETQKLADALNQEMQVVEGAEHFQEQKEFEDILIDILSIENQ